MELAQQWLRTQAAISGGEAAATLVAVAFLQGLDTVQVRMEHSDLSKTSQLPIVRATVPQLEPLADCVVECRNHSNPCMHGWFPSVQERVSVDCRYADQVLDLLLDTRRAWVLSTLQAAVEKGPMSVEALSDELAYVASRIQVRSHPRVSVYAEGRGKLAHSERLCVDSYRTCAVVA
jgi:hypothetical protein